MNLLSSRFIKAVCLAAVVTLLSSCGSGKTNDPFVPTRLIGLGDALNDTSAGQYTVRGTGEVSTVVGQVAVLFGNGATTQSYVTTGDATVADLNRQVNGLGSIQATELIVITSGTAEFVARAGAGGATPAATAYLNSLKTALDNLKNKGAKRILLMTVVDKAVGIDQDVVDFNSVVSGGLGQYADVARLANIDRPEAVFPNWASHTNTPYCGAVTTGCAVNGQDATLYFLADSIHPTPTGIRWIAQYMYNATASGWR